MEAGKTHSMDPTGGSGCRRSTRQRQAASHCAPISLSPRAPASERGSLCGPGDAPAMPFKDQPPHEGRDGRAAAQGTPPLVPQTPSASDSPARPSLSRSAQAAPESRRTDTGRVDPSTASMLLALDPLVLCGAAVPRRPRSGHVSSIYAHHGQHHQQQQGEQQQQQQQQQQREQQQQQQQQTQQQKREQQQQQQIKQQQTQQPSKKPQEQDGPQRAKRQRCGRPAQQAPAGWGPGCAAAAAAAGGSAPAVAGACGSAPLGVPQPGDAVDFRRLLLRAGCVSGWHSGVVLAAARGSAAEGGTLLRIEADHGDSGPAWLPLLWRPAAGDGGGDGGSGALAPSPLLLVRPRYNPAAQLGGAGAASDRAGGFPAPLPRGTAVEVRSHGGAWTPAVVGDGGLDAHGCGAIVNAAAPEGDGRAWVATGVPAIRVAPSAAAVGLRLEPGSAEPAADRARGITAFACLQQLLRANCAV